MICLLIDWNAEEFFRSWFSSTESRSSKTTIEKTGTGGKTNEGDY
jgi:hypothetical protein